MKVGMLARAEDRGLGMLTWAVYRNLAPDVCIVIDPGALSRGFPQHFERYPDGIISTWDGHRLQREAVEALAECDVVYSAETFYDWSLVPWLHEQGIATVLHAMPEFWKHNVDPTIPMPTVVWNPTPWRHETLPEDRRYVVPIPVGLQRAAKMPGFHDGPLRVIHVAGHRALADRNGTISLLASLRGLHREVDVHILTQESRLPKISDVPENVTLRYTLNGLEDARRLYDDADVLVMPRRFGGLSLPVQEALAAGLAVVMPECSPNQWWPTLRYPVEPGPDVEMPCGIVRIFNTGGPKLSTAIDRLAVDRDLLTAAQRRGREWAAEHSWPLLRGSWREHLEQAIGRVRHPSRWP